MGRLLRVIGISTAPPAGHNSLNAEFKYKRGEVAPHVTTRQYGSIPGVIPADIHHKHTHATDDPADWMNYLTPGTLRDGSYYPGPNLTMWPPKQATLVPRKLIKEVLESADELAEQYVQAIAEYIHRPPGISSDSAYLELTRKMGAKTLLSPLPAPVQPRKLMVIGWEEK